MGFWKSIFGTKVNLSPGAGGDIYVRGKSFCEMMQDNVRLALAEEEVHNQIAQEWSDHQKIKVISCKDYEEHKLQGILLWNNVVTTSEHHCKHWKVLEYMIEPGDTVQINVDGTLYNITHESAPFGVPVIMIYKVLDGI
jgi:hypothetical protein